MLYRTYKFSQFYRQKSQPTQALVTQTYHPLFSNFLFTNLFSIKFLYFLIISSLFPYFNLFVSIFIQSYVNIKLHVLTPSMKLCRFKNRTPPCLEYIYCTLFPLCHSNQDMYPFLKDASFRPCFCFVHTIGQFSRILRFSHINRQIFRRVPFVDGSDIPLNSECINFNDRVGKVQKNYYFGAIF